MATRSPDTGAPGTAHAPGAATGEGRREQIVLGATVAGLVGGVVAYLAGAEGAADVLWAVTSVIALVPLTVSVISDLRHGDVGVDVIALIAMGTAIALGEFLAGAVIALMLSGGLSLEAFAAGRARRELTALLDRAPRSANILSNGAMRTVPLSEVEPGHRLLVRPGEIVPVDGVLLGIAVLDEAALTGESIPVEKRPGSSVESGSVNAGSSFEMRAVAGESDSTYAGIVRLVEEAQRSKAPFIRLADRFAVWFLPFTLVSAVGAWLVSGDPERALAVLVVATPCPLILAAPVAIVAGISQAARRGVIFKGGGAAEALARAEVLLFDKTGTLTAGRAALSRVLELGSMNSTELLRLAGSLDQLSAHVLAEAITSAAVDHGLELSFPTDVHEEPGMGIRGNVDGHTVALGKAEWVQPGSSSFAEVKRVRRRTAGEAAIGVFVSVDGTLAGAIVLTDPVRPDAAATIRAIRRAGIDRIVMVTGDRADVADSVSTAIGVDVVLAERTPGEKVEAVLAERRIGTTVMVGDGLNDAPALAAADVGVAMGARGVAASSEAADVVLLVDSLDRVADAIRIAGRSRSVAMQSVVAGMGLSMVAMMFAAWGLIVPVAGALLQEVIDLAVILNALRALTPGRGNHRAPAEAALGRHFLDEHVRLLPRVDRLREVADRLEDIPVEEARTELASVIDFLGRELLPHEQEEGVKAFPTVARALGGEDPVGGLLRTHLEIAHLVRLLTRLEADLPPGEIDADDAREIRRVLYSLHAILGLHFAQEEEAYTLALGP